MALVHSFYSSREPSGENAVVLAERDALAAAGVDVALVRTDTDDRERDVAYGPRAALRVATGRGSDPAEQIARMRPDVVHVHNLFPNWGERWVEDLDVPLVHTLHNYRPMCAAGILYRDGGVCTLCVGGDTRPALRHACYRGSRVATLPLALRNRGGASRNRLLRSADRIIVLSSSMRERYRASGIPESHSVVWPNFLPDRLDPGPSRPGVARAAGRYLFVGRTSEQKGIDLLVANWPTGSATLDIIGDGPLLETVQALAADRSNIRVWGRQDRRAVLGAMASATALIVPSRSFEGFPLIYAEALATSLPVLTFEPCDVAEFVREDGTGTVLSWTEPLADQLPGRAALDGWGRRCREVFEAKYTQAAYVDRALGLYRGLV